MDTTPIYTVTLMNFFMGLRETLDEEVSSAFRKRSIGYFHDAETACQAILSPPHDLTDHLYYHAVIERIEPGLYPRTEAIHWFTYDVETSSFKATADPVLAHRSFVMG